MPPHALGVAWGPRQWGTELTPTLPDEGNAAVFVLVDHVSACVRRVLCRRHQAPSQGTRRFPSEAVFGALGVLQLRRVQLGATPWASR